MHIHNKIANTIQNINDIIINCIQMLLFTFSDAKPCWSSLILEIGSDYISSVFSLLSP